MFEIKKMLRSVIINGTGKNASVQDWQIAGKTGTSQSFRDAWFVGFTSNIDAGCYIGYDIHTPLGRGTGGGST